MQIERATKSLTRILQLVNHCFILMSARQQQMATLDLAVQCLHVFGAVTAPGLNLRLCLCTCANIIIFSNENDAGFGFQHHCSVHVTSSAETAVQMPPWRLQATTALRMEQRTLVLTNNLIILAAQKVNIQLYTSTVYADLYHVLRSEFQPIISDSIGVG